MMTLLVIWFAACLGGLWGLRDRERYLERERARREERDRRHHELLAALQKR